MSNPDWRDDEYIRDHEVSEIEDVADALVNQHLPGCPAAFSDEGGACRCDDTDEQVAGDIRTQRVERYSDEPPAEGRQR